MANQYLDGLDPWPLGTPLPDDTLFIISVPSLQNEFRIEQSQLPAASGSQAAVLQVAASRTDLLAAAGAGKLVPGTQYQVTGRGVGKLPVVVAAVSRTQLAAIGTRLESNGSVTDVTYDLTSDTDTALTGGGQALTAAILASITQQGPGITLSVVNGKLLISATSQPAPEAPRNPQTDDVSNIFSHSLVTGFPSASDYELEKSAEAAGYSVRTDAYVQNGRVYFPGITGPHAVGTVRSRVVASGSRPAGTPVSNTVAFTGPVADAGSITFLDVQGSDAIPSFTVTAS
ncbi:hypothetical protein [Hymenobacter rigui]|uniref:Uncharacterized protein n=1 Tax=Hymenobacter rigui TaxID=334424 RepID=A0A3R9MNS8_9BACT|nr:hypothetical protein [Hymenobacter rigui]RSK50127.1 hypothetical protein EI291_05600 [Hymenobacter rigui]